MMLRSRNQVANNNQTCPGEISALKRHADNQLNEKEQPRRKRAVLSDLSNKKACKQFKFSAEFLTVAISNSLLIDSSKKVNESKVISKQARAIPKRPVPVKQETTDLYDVKLESPKNKRLTVLREVLDDPSGSADKTIVTEDKTEDDPFTQYDYDAENIKDPFSVPSYAFDIFRYYVHREKKFIIGDYMKHQRYVTKDMRAVLADWMVEVQENFELNHETLYLAVKLTDMYLDKVPNVPRDDLQLIASTAIFISSKFDERSPPLIDDFLYICEDAYDRNALTEMEMKLLRVVGFDLGAPLSYRYVRRYARVKKVDLITLTLARYILETSLMFYEFLSVQDSLLGAAAFLMALRMKNIGDWDDILYKYSGYRLKHVEPLMWRLNHMMRMRPKIYSKLVTVHNKYSHEVFFEVAAVPLLEDRVPLSEPVGPPSDYSFT